MRVPFSPQQERIVLMAMCFDDEESKPMKKELGQKMKKCKKLEPFNHHIGHNVYTIFLKIYCVQCGIK